MTSFTFISYQSDDRDIAFRICEGLERRGIPCWIAPRDIHAGEYAGEITRALRDASNFVVICSKSASASPHVRNEVSLAFGNKCRIVPYCLDKSTLDDSLEYYFAGKQRVFVEHGDIDAGIDKLYSVLSGDKVIAELQTSDNKKKKRKGLFVALSVVLALIAVSVFLFFANAPDSANDANGASVRSPSSNRIRLILYPPGSALRERCLTRSLSMRRTSVSLMMTCFIK